MAAPHGPVRVALVGCGEVCEHKHLPALARVRGARVVALVDPDAARAAHVAGRFGIPRRLPDIPALLASGAPDIVGVLTPPDVHAATALAAIGAGCHVLVEKPLALSLDEADALVEAERAGSRRCLTGLHMRWHRLIRRARRALRQGAVGRIESIRAAWNSPRGDGGIPQWKRTRASGGGALVELGVHVFDLWRILAGAEVTTVHAVTTHGTRDDESAAVTAVLDNGVLASAVLSERTSHDIEIQINGDRGRIRLGCQQFDGYAHYALQETAGMPGPRVRHALAALRDLPGGLLRMRRLGDYGDSYREQWQHMVAVAAGAPPACTFDDGRAALRIVLAAAASADRGESVRVADAPRTLAAGMSHA